MRETLSIVRIKPKKDLFPLKILTGDKYFEKFWKKVGNLHGGGFAFLDEFM